MYEKADEPGMCIKVSNRANTCRRWSNEYKKITQLVDNIDKSDLGARFTKRMQNVAIIKPTHFDEHSGTCYMFMPRVYRPEGVKKEIEPTIQAHLGCDIGLQYISKHVHRGLLKSMAYELGIAMGCIHYIGKNDAQNVELFLGKMYMSRKPQLFLADFDMSEQVPNPNAINEAVIRKLAWSLDAALCFPKRDVDNKLYDLFRLGYTQVADATGTRQAAEHVMEIFDL